MGDICQWNVVVLYICGQKFGVKGTVLGNFETLLTKFCSLLYTDSHYYRLKVRGCSFPNVIEKLLALITLLPCSNGHKAKQLCSASLIFKLNSLQTFQDHAFVGVIHVKKSKNILGRNMWLGWKIC